MEERRDKSSKLAVTRFQNPLSLVFAAWKNKTLRAKHTVFNDNICPTQCTHSPKSAMVKIKKEIKRYQFRHGVHFENYTKQVCGLVFIGSLGLVR